MVGWAATVVGDFRGEGFCFSYSQVVGKVQHAMPGAFATVFARDAWKVVLHLTVTIDGAPYYEEDQTVFYGVGMGEIYRKAHIVNHFRAPWFEQETNVLPEGLW